MALSKNDWLALVNQEAGIVDKKKKEQKAAPKSVADFRKLDQETQKAVPYPIKPNVNPEFAIEHPVLNKVLDTVTTPLQKFFGNPFVERSSQSAVETMMLTDNPKKTTTGSKGLDLTADLLGGLGGFVANPSGGIGNAGAEIFNASTKAAERFLPPLIPSFGKTAIGLGVGGVGYEGARAGLNDREFTPGEALAAFGLNAAIPVAGRALRGLPEFLNPSTTKIEGLDLSAPYKWEPTPDPWRSTRSGMLMEPETVLPKPALPKLTPQEIRQGLHREIGLTPDPVRQFMPTLKAPDPYTQAMDDLQRGIQTAQNYVRHNDILAAYPAGTTIEQAFADIKANTGVDLPALMVRVEEAQKAPKLRDIVMSDIETTRLGQVAGVIPKPTKLMRGNTARYIGAKPETVTVTPQPRRQTRSGATLFDDVAMPEVAATAEARQLPKNKVMAEAIEQPPKEYSTTIEVPNVADDVPKALEGIDVTKLKDTKFTLYNHKDLDRNFRDVFKGGYEQVKKAILDPFDKSKGQKVDFEKQILTDLNQNVVKRLGIRKGSKLSALVQKYGEGEITIDQLKQMTPKWQQVVEADKWFRQVYDRLIDQVNAVRAQIYPTNPDKIIPKRKDYYRHFKEFAEGFEGLKNIFDSPANIDPHLAGVSDFTLPKSKWASPWQKRTGNKTDYDAVGGFLDYLPAASYAIHIDPHIPRFERLADELATATEKTKNLNGFIEWLRDFARDLAGKTNFVDRAVIKYIPGSRKALQVLTWANNRIKANVVLGKAGSLLAQTANIPNGIAFAKQYSVPGAGRALASIFKKDAPMYQSNFIKERYGSKIYRDFNTTWIEDLAGKKLPGNIDNLVSPGKLKDFAVWMMETADRIGTSFVWNSAYSKGLAQKVADPIKYADNVTRRLVAGRGIGEVPLVQKSKLFQLVAPFQLEVANLWHVMGDFVKTKDFGALATLFVANHLFNQAMKEIRGSEVVFDPIEAMLDAFREEDLTPGERIGRLGGEVLSNVPLGQTIAANLVNNEWERKRLFGRQDPTRYGSGLLLTSAIEDPASKFILPFGGDQVSKTYKGVKALQQGGVYTQDGKQLMYHIEPTTTNKVKSVLFGPTATGEALEYFKQNRRPLTEKQTQEYKKSVASGKNPKAEYGKIMLERDLKRVDEEIEKLMKEQRKEVSAERTKKLSELRKQRGELLKKKRGL